MATAAAPPRGKDLIEGYVHSLNDNDSARTLAFFTEDAIVEGGTVAAHLGLKEIKAHAFYPTLLGGEGEGSDTRIRYTHYNEAKRYGLIDFDYDWTFGGQTFALHVVDVFYLDESETKIRRLDICYNTHLTLPAYTKYQAELAAKATAK